MRRLFYFFLILFEIFFGFLLYGNMIHIPCFFKTIFHISCPGCGLTRAMIEVMHFHFMKAIYYNFLIIPVVLFCFFCNIFIVLDIIKDRMRVSFLVQKIFSWWRVFLPFLILSEVVNIYHGI